MLPLLAGGQTRPAPRHDQTLSGGDVTVEYGAKNNGWVSSAATVAEKINCYQDVCGFGSLLVFCFDYADKPEAWHTSLGMLAEEVMPKLQHLKPASATSAAG